MAQITHDTWSDELWGIGHPTKPTTKTNAKTKQIIAARMLHVKIRLGLSIVRAIADIAAMVIIAVVRKWEDGGKLRKGGREGAIG